uniref:Uncharacterized protein n=1 Tax=Meloidogyne enterolobii TaxID=390850 RepID=A0A6V7U0Z5_MELEN|nr:unnamed protein product [Meloidogyne enterolobii]
MLFCIIFCHSFIAYSGYQIILQSLKQIKLFVPHMNVLGVGK